MIIDDDEDITNLFSIFLEHNGYIVNAYTNSLICYAIYFIRVRDNNNNYNN